MGNAESNSLVWMTSLFFYQYDSCAWPITLGRPRLGRSNIPLFSRGASHDIHALSNHRSVCCVSATEAAAAEGHKVNLVNVIARIK